MLLSEIDISDVEIDWTSYSGLTLHRACPQKWTYRYVYGLGEPYGTDAMPERHFGNWWHALRAADSIERGRAIGSIKWLPTKKGIRCTDGGPIIDPTTDDLRAQVLEAAVHWYETVVPDEHKAKWVEKMGAHLPRLLKNLDIRYRADDRSSVRAADALLRRRARVRRAPRS